jgi:putative protease
LHLLVRTHEQLVAAIECCPDSITLDYLELYGLRPSIEQIQAAGITARVASPRILKPSEQKIVRFLLSLECEILVRSGGLLKGLVDDSRTLPPLIGDFSLNAANAMSATIYLQMGLSRITPTYDLNSKQIEELAERVDASSLEVIAYSHLPVFHTEHCVFCRFLSDGTDSTNCGHPCESHRVAVRDAGGREHPVMADVGCRNTVFGAEAQTDPAALAQWHSAGIQHYRIEFVHESPQQVSRITVAFRDYFNAGKKASQLARELEQLSPQNTTKGSLFVPKDFKELVQLH